MIFKRGLGWNLKRAIWVAGLLCFVYASSDEWHQTFVPPRDGCFRDVMIDMIGVTLASLWFWKRNSKTPHTEASSTTSAKI